MICYKDQTFCAAECANRTCFDKLTKADRRGAQALHLPLSMGDFSAGCADYIKPTKEIK